MQKLLLSCFAIVAFFYASSQTVNVDSLRNAKRDSTLRALIHADSVKVEKEFAAKEKEDKTFQTQFLPITKYGSLPFVANDCRKVVTASSSDTSSQTPSHAMIKKASENKKMNNNHKPIQNRSLLIPPSFFSL